MTWEAVPSVRPGRQQAYSDAATQACLALKVLFGLPLRQTNEFVASLLKLVGLDWTAPDFCTLCRRQKTLSVAIPYKVSTGPLHLLVDSAGIKVEHEGEWNACMHGGPKRRLWRKIHIRIDEKTLEIRAIEVTSSSIGDAPMLPPCSTKSHQIRSSAVSRPTEHPTYANATMQLRPGMPMPSSHQERMPSYGNLIHLEPKRETTQFDPRNIWAAHCGDR